VGERGGSAGTPAPGSGRAEESNTRCPNGSAPEQALGKLTSKKEGEIRANFSSAFRAA
jgi:hypothetical protein